jgi:hypothetical protein
MGKDRSKWNAHFVWPLLNQIVLEMYKKGHWIIALVYNHKYISHMWVYFALVYNIFAKRNINIQKVLKNSCSHGL